MILCIYIYININKFGHDFDIFISFFILPHLVQWLVRQAGQIAHVLKGAHQDLRLSQRGAREAQVLSRHPGLLRRGVHKVDQLLADQMGCETSVFFFFLNVTIFLSVYLSIYPCILSNPI